MCKAKSRRTPTSAVKASDLICQVCSHGTRKPASMI